jgi:hypothetical protein
MAKLAVLSPKRVTWPVLALVLATGCHRLYEIRGVVIVGATGPVGEKTTPAVLCSGHGGPLETSGVYGRPIFARTGSSEATIFCYRPNQMTTFPLRESIYYGSIPRRAHVYAWLAPVPGAVQLCEERGTPMLKVDYRILYRMMSPKESEKPVARSFLERRPCGSKPSPSIPMDYAVTFDPENPTWTEHENGTWIEQRTLHIK